MTTLSPRLEKIFSKTKIICFGRFTIEVPETATVVFGRITVNYEISRYPNEAGTVDARIATHLKRFDQEKFINKKMDLPGSLYGQVLSGDVAGQKIFIGANYNSYNIDSYVPINADLFLFESRGVGETKEVRQQIDEIGVIAHRLKARAEESIPAVTGICLDGSFIDFSPRYENISIGIRLAELPDVHLSISTLKNQQSLNEFSSLEHRLQAAEKEAFEEGQSATYKRIKFFRRAPPQIGDWVGEEALARMPAEKGNFSGHQFQFYSIGAPNDILRPVADVQLDTGVLKNSTRATAPSLTDEEALALWDRLTRSIHARSTTQIAIVKK